MAIPELLPRHYAIMPIQLPIKGEGNLITAAKEEKGDIFCECVVVQKKLFVDRSGKGTNVSSFLFLFSDPLHGHLAASPSPQKSGGKWGNSSRMQWGGLPSCLETRPVIRNVNIPISWTMALIFLLGTVSPARWYVRDSARRGGVGG